MRSYGVPSLLIALAGCAQQPTTAAGKAPPELELEGAGLRFFRGSELRAVGRAKAATFERETGDLRAQALDLRLVATASRTDVDLRAALGRGNVRSQEADFSGAVKLSQAGAVVAVTDRAHLAGREQLASGADPVDVFGSGYRVRADGGFRMEMAQPGHVELFGPTKTWVEAKP